MPIAPPYSTANAQALVAELSDLAGIKAPRFCWSKRVRLANYFALSDSLHMHPAFAASLSFAEFQAVLAHEVGHARQRPLTLLFALGDILFNPVTLLLAWGIWPGHLVLAGFIGVLFLARLLSAPKVTLLKELAADRFCVRALRDEQPLYDLLTRLAGRKKMQNQVVRQRLEQLETLTALSSAS
jgi:Zn-dependent protease with chaperone function